MRAVHIRTALFHVHTACSQSVIHPDFFEYSDEHLMRTQTNTHAYLEVKHARRGLRWHARLHGWRIQCYMHIVALPCMCLELQHASQHSALRHHQWLLQQATQLEPVRGGHARSGSKPGRVCCAAEEHVKPCGKAVDLDHARPRHLQACSTDVILTCFYVINAF